MVLQYTHCHSARHGGKGPAVSREQLAIHLTLYTSFTCLSLNGGRVFLEAELTSLLQFCTQRGQVDMCVYIVIRHAPDTVYLFYLSQSQWVKGIPPWQSSLAYCNFVLREVKGLSVSKEQLAMQLIIHTPSTCFCFNWQKGQPQLLSGLAYCKLTRQGALCFVTGPMGPLCLECNSPCT